MLEITLMACAIIGLWIYAFVMFRLKPKSRKRKRKARVQIPAKEEKKTNFEDLPHV